MIVLFYTLLAHDLDASDVHGSDCLGNVSTIPQPDMTLLQKEHAVNFLVSSVKEHLGEITILALGPLTNLALACKIDPTFKNNLKQVYIMGGSLEAKGNISLCGEFNFHFDPEAAYITLSELTCPLVLVTLETCKRCPFKADFMAIYLGQKTKKGEFLNAILSLPIEVFKKKNLVDYSGVYDPFVAAVFLEPDLVLQSQEVFTTVETQGKHTRGQCVFDWRNILGKRKNVVLPLEIDAEKFKSLLVESLQ